MDAIKFTKSKKSYKNSSDANESKSAKKLEARRRIEDLVEEKRLRNEMELDFDY